MESPIVRLTAEESVMQEAVFVSLLIGFVAIACLFVLVCARVVDPAEELLRVCSIAASQTGDGSRPRAGREPRDLRPFR